ncbi:rhodanese-like domain-containing protein [Halocola ammonii]
MKEITPKELKEKLDNKEEIQVIDVRDDHEVDICNIGGKQIPMSEVMSHVDEIRKDIPVVVHCRAGARSAAVITALEQKYGMDNLYNLTGGILAWADEVDPSLEKY